MSDELTAPITYLNKKKTDKQKKLEKQSRAGRRPIGAPPQPATGYETFKPGQAMINRAEIRQFEELEKGEDK